MQPSIRLLPHQSSRGFDTIYKAKVRGRGFAELLERVSIFHSVGGKKQPISRPILIVCSSRITYIFKVAEVDAGMRVRFTSPHPKDFSDDVLFAIRDLPNVCNQLHLPAQSGSSAVLERMYRGCVRDGEIWMWKWGLKPGCLKCLAAGGLGYVDRKNGLTTGRCLYPRYTREAYLELVARIRDVLPGKAKRVCKAAV